MSAWSLIQHQELPSAQASIVFSSIPQTYTDLRVFFSVRTTLGSIYHFDDFSVRLNGDSGNNYTNRALRAREGTIAGLGGTGNRIDVYEACASGAPANSFGNGTIYIPNYTLSGSKNFSAEGFSITNGSTVQGGLTAGLWTGNGPVTSITLFSANSTNLVQYSSATLYGLLKGSAGGVTVS